MGCTSFYAIALKTVNDALPTIIVIYVIIENAFDTVIKSDFRILFIYYYIRVKYISPYYPHAYNLLNQSVASYRKSCLMRFLIVDRVHHMILI